MIIQMLVHQITILMFRNIASRLNIKDIQTLFINIMSVDFGVSFLHQQEWQLSSLLLTSTTNNTNYSVHTLRQYVILPYRVLCLCGSSSQQRIYSAKKILVKCCMYVTTVNKYTVRMIENASHRKQTSYESNRFFTVQSTPYLEGGAPGRFTI